MKPSTSITRRSDMVPFISAMAGLHLAKITSKPSIYAIDWLVDWATFGTLLVVAFYLLALKHGWITNE